MTSTQDEPSTTTAAPRPMTQTEKLMVAGGCASAATCFLPWFRIAFSNTVGAIQLPGNPGGSISGNAFNSWAGILIFLCSVVVAAVPFAISQGMLRLDKAKAAAAALGAAGLSVVCALIFFGQASQTAGPISAGPTLWFYLALLTVAFMTFQAIQYWKSNQRVRAT